jgi:hypothetical protein
MMMTVPSLASSSFSNLDTRLRAQRCCAVYGKRASCARRLSGHGLEPLQPLQQISCCSGAVEDFIFSKTMTYGMPLQLLQSYSILPHAHVARTHARARARRCSSSSSNA